MIIFDLDGTLRDCDHRRHLVMGKKRDYRRFHKLGSEDKPRRGVVDVMQALIRQQREVRIWSAADEEWRAEVMQWLTRYAPLAITANVQVRMRPDGDNTPDDQLKERWLDETLAEGWVIDMVFDDRDKVVAMWRRRGIICAQVAPGAF